jgi:hypothetical protein
VTGLHISKRLGNVEVLLAPKAQQSFSQEQLSGQTKRMED